MVKAHIRGSSWMMSKLTAWGVLDVVVNYPLANFTFGVPLWQYHMESTDLLRIDPVFINCFCSHLARLKKATLFDCGANIGIISARVCARTEAISNIIAFEPNQQAFPILEKNMAALPVHAQAVPCAVANFVGSGKLESPAYDDQDTARYLAPGDGPIQVTTVDSYKQFGHDVAIKVDVEGGELEVLKGAQETIRSATACVIAVEAHPKVAGRTGVDPVECLRFLESIRPFQFSVAETGETLSADRPVIQPGQTEVLNVICTSR